MKMNTKKIRKVILPKLCYMDFEIFHLFISIQLVIVLIF